MNNGITMGLRYAIADILLMAVTFGAAMVTMKIRVDDPSVSYISLNVGIISLVIMLLAYRDKTWLFISVIRV